MNNVDHPDHYASSSIECKDAMSSAFGDRSYVYKSGNEYKNVKPICFYWWGCVFKYIWRWRRKNGIEDLKKARKCLDFMIEELESGESNGKN